MSPRDASPFSRQKMALIPLPLSSTTTATSSPSSTSTATTTTPTTSSTSASSSTSTTTSNPSSSSSTIASLTTQSSSSTTSLTTATSNSITTAPGGIITITSTQVASSTTSSAASTGAASGSSKSFFQNTGAVAGVFTAVGLVALVIIIAIIINIVRRRQAREFDREIAEAAAEAAAARAPAFLDDEQDNYGSGGYGGSFAGKFSDASHGTFSQPPMTDTYGMREIVPGEVYDPAIYSATGIGAGAAGIGVARARSRRDFAAGLQDGASPYPAFAGPRYDMRNVSRSPPPAFAPTGSSERDLLEAAGLGGGAAGIHRGPSQQTYHTDLTKARSLTSTISEGHSSNQSQSFRPFNPPSALQPGVKRNSLLTTSLPYASGNLEEQPAEASPLPNPFAGSSEGGDHQNDGADSEPEEEPKRILRVANE